MFTADLTKELGQNFIEYAAEVNSDRAIPDATSGLKPVAKRILWGAYQMGASSSKPHNKSAMIVGEVMGKYHPHGDTSIYSAMARLSQDWVMRYPLIHWHGINGSILGDGPAASRYTEARLSKLAEDGMLNNIKKKNVQFGLNYTDTLDEPDTLPSLFPNLLCNPNSGIGVAIACSWAPHNLGEVTTAIFDYIDGKEPMLPGPDFPTGGVIINKNDIPSIMRSGHGTVKIRGKYKVENKNKLVFYELPYGVTIEALLDDIAEVANAKELIGIKRIYDDTNEECGVRLVIECDKDTTPDSVAQQLFMKTKLQSSFSYNQVALVNKTPVELNLKQCIEVYVNHNIDCIVKEYNFELPKTRDRLHIVDGLLKALEDIDNIIALIKGSKSAAAAKENLIAKYNFSEEQAKAIVDMKLGRLAGLEKIELQQEQAELKTTLDEILAVLNNKDKQISILKERLSVLTKKYSDARRTDLAQIELPKKQKEQVVVEPKDCVVVLNKKGAIKRIDAKSFKAAKRNTVGVKTHGDITVFSQKTNTQDMLMVFTSKGKMYRLLVDNIPEGTNASTGTPISALIEFEDGEVPMAYTTLTRDNDKKFIFFATKNGTVKKVPLEEYDSMKRSGIVAIKFKDGDELVDVTFINQEEMMLVTKNGMAIRFETAGMPISSRIAMGVKGIKLNEDDYVIGALPISGNSQYLAIVSEDGMGKKIDLSEFNTQSRAGKGVVCSKKPIAGAAIITNENNLLINGDKSSLVVAASDIPLLGRTSAGNVMIKNNEKILSISEI